MNTLTDKELRKEYKALMSDALRMVDSYEQALHVLKSSGTDHSRAVVAEMIRRGLRGIAHEDGRFDYTCGSDYCKCSQ